MSTTKELNNWIEQQLNSKKENAVMNEHSKVLVNANDKRGALLKQESSLQLNSIKLRNEQDIAIDESLKSYKEMIRNGEYGEENKDMKFIDEE